MYVTLITPVLAAKSFQVASKDTLSYSLSEIYAGILNPKPAGAIFGNWVDVRDVAEAHVLALKEEQASGQRLVVSAGE